MKNQIQTIRTLVTTIVLFASAVSAFSEEPAPEKNGVTVLMKSADEGDAEAQFQLARAYFRGFGVEENGPLTLEWMQKAAAQNHPEALSSMGYFFSEGILVEANEATAVDWFRKGAEAGSLKAQLNLGLMLRQAKAIEHNNEKSLAWIQQAADAGLPEAQMVLGRLYFTGDALMNRDYEKAVQYLQAPAIAGDPICQNMLGVASRDGLGTAPDRDAAEDWFRKAAMQNNAKAQANLALLLGVESPESPTRKEALKWLIIASDKAEPTAKKTFAELTPTFPAALLASARKEAATTAIMLRSEEAKKKQAAESAEVPTEE